MCKSVKSTFALAVSAPTCAIAAPWNRPSAAAWRPERGREVYFHAIVVPGLGPVVKGAMFSWCISCFLHLGLQVFLFSSIYTKIPLKEWSLCHEYLQQHDWLVLAALAGRLMDMAQILSFAAEDFLFPHPAVKLQPSGTERLSTNISLFKSVRSWGAAAQV